jgi:DNA-binding NarL/FixJ family response regulator
MIGSPAARRVPRRRDFPASADSAWAASLAGPDGRCRQPRDHRDRHPSRWNEKTKLVAKGQSNAEIAATLYVSHRTVKTHVSRLLMKLDARDRAQLVMIAYETGVVMPGAT